MKISLNSMKKYTKIVLTSEELAEMMAQKIGEVEDVQNLAEKYKGILVAQIKEVQEHPDADKLNIYKIEAADGELIQVVAGDKSLSVGDKVAYFPPETKVPHNAYPDKFDGIVRSTKLRGVVSDGMLASAKELDISGNHDQVLRLDDEIGQDASPGDLFADVYGLDDYVYEIENKALINRPECFGLIGLAREVSAIQGLKYETPEWFKYWDNADLIRSKSLLINKQEYSLSLKIENEAGKLCPRYMAVVIDGITVKSSPVWMQIELMKAGVRPVNNVVDITNYLMIQTGQPLHAFDYDKVVKKSAGCVGEDGVCEGRIVVRQAHKGEIITVINGDKVELDEEIVVITDGTDPIAIGGVMGGLDTEVDENTKRVILEAANFDMYNIRKTSNKVGITSDATTRYSRNQDPHMCEPVLLRSLELYKAYTGGDVASNICDEFLYPREEREVKFNLGELNRLIGRQFTKKEVVSVLENVELEVSELLCDDKEAEKVLKDGYDSPLDDEDEILVVRVPTYRQDLHIKEDVYEEVSRIYGFDKIPMKLPSRKVKPVAINNILKLESQLRDLLISMGCYDLLTYNFVSADLYDKINPKLKDRAFRLTNSLSPELEYMRTMLMPNLLEKVYFNNAQGQRKFALFEINKYHIKGVENKNGLPYEFRSLAFVLSVDDLAQQKISGSAYYGAKRYLEELLEGLKVGVKVNFYGWDEVSQLGKLPVWIDNMKGCYEYNSSGVITYTIDESTHYLGVVGQISISLCDVMKLPKYTAGFELRTDELLNIAYTRGFVDRNSRFPKVVQDICYIVPESVKHVEIEEALAEVLEGRVFYEIETVDIYKDDDLEKAGKRQETLRIIMRGIDNAISKKSLNVIRSKLEKVGDWELKG